jgi:hypothetical protein
MYVYVCIVVRLCMRMFFVSVSYGYAKLRTIFALWTGKVLVCVCFSCLYERVRMRVCLHERVRMTECVNLTRARKKSQISRISSVSIKTIYWHLCMCIFVYVLSRTNK